MILSSILEAFWGPGLLTFCFLVAPVTNACMFFGSQLTSLIFSVKSDVEEAKNSSQCWLRVVTGRGRRQRRSQRREGEASPPSFEWLSIIIQHALLPLDEVRRIEKATASAADLWDPRLGCLDAWMLVFLIAWRQI